MTRGYAWTCTALILLGPPGWGIVPEAKAEPLVTDRPDFTESTETVPPGRWQLEAGYTFSKREDEKKHALGELLLRVGLGPRIELRLAGNSHVWLDSHDADAHGFEDTSLGVKVKLVESSERFELTRPAVAVIVATTLPTGDDDFSEDDPQPEVTLASAWDLSERFSLGSNLTYSFASEADERFHQFSGSLVLGFALTETWGAFVEYFGRVPESEGGPNASFFDGGLTYLINDDLQLDARAGVGVFNAKNPDYFTGVGVAWRW
ncbi:MAG: transporter [Candidatus Methylomirabilales bacterium]